MHVILPPPAGGRRRLWWRVRQITDYSAAGVLRCIRRAELGRPSRMQL